MGDNSMPTIGIVSSIDYNAEMQTSFLAGLNMNPVPNFIILDKRTYAAVPLQNAVDALIAAPVDLIVTFGGLVAWNAAWVRTPAHGIRFISLIGGQPAAGFTPPPSGLFVGCCDLQSYSQNLIRINWLRAHVAGVGNNPANIGLLYGSHSVMRTDELNAWIAAGGGQRVDATNGYTNPATFNVDFNGFLPGITAIVISADPHFHRFRDPLIQAANGSGRYICYPLPSYRNPNGSSQPTPGNAVVIGPDFYRLNPINANAAFHQMGVMARNVLGGAAPGVVPVPQEPASPIV